MIAISSAYKEALIAIDINGKRNFLSMDSNCKHSENILYNIDKMLDDMDASIRDNDALAVVLGPGSFTGLRIGTALVKGLKVTSDCKVVGILTPQLIAYSYIKKYNPNEMFYVGIDALSGLVYVAKFSKDGEMLSNLDVIKKEDYDKLDGIKVGLSEENIGDKLVKPSPEDLLELAEFKLANNDTIDEVHLNPLYLRKSQAEMELAKKEKMFKI